MLNAMFLFPFYFFAVVMPDFLITLKLIHIPGYFSGTYLRHYYADSAGDHAAHHRLSFGNKKRKGNLLPSSTKP